MCTRIFQLTHVSSQVSISLKIPKISALRAQLKGHKQKTKQKNIYIYIYGSEPCTTNSMYGYTYSITFYYTTDI